MKYNKRYSYKNKISLFLKIVRMWYKLEIFYSVIAEYESGRRKMSSYLRKLVEEYHLHHLSYALRSIIILFSMVWWIIVIELNVKHYLYMYKDSYKIIRKNKNVYYNKFYYYLVVIEKILTAGRGLVKYLQRCNYDINRFREVKWGFADKLTPILYEINLMIYGKVCGFVGVTDGINSSTGFRNDMLKSFFKKYIQYINKNKKISEQFIFSCSINNSQLLELKLRYKNIIICRKRRWCYYYLIVTQYAEYLSHTMVYGMGELMFKSAFLLMRLLKKQMREVIYRKLYRNYMYYLINGYRSSSGSLSAYGERKKIIHNKGNDFGGGKANNF